MFGLRSAGARETRERGAVMVEFALVLMLLLLLVFGIINFGYLFGQKLSLNSAVRDGARLAVVPGDDAGRSVDSTAEVQDIVRARTGGMLVADNVTVSMNSPDGCDSLEVGDALTVSATYSPARLLIPMPVPGFPDSLTLNSEAVFRCEW